jgi:uncharacterized protein (UPF0333 family)
MKYMGKKGQVSLEYLMTYGIAIAIVVIAVAALYSMGVFSPSSSTVACSPCFSNFAFVDYSDGTLVLKNGAYDLESVSVSCSPDTDATNCSVSSTISANQQFNITGIDTTGDISVTITYTRSASGLTHNDTATIHN